MYTLSGLFLPLCHQTRSFFVLRVDCFARLSLYSPRFLSCQSALSPHLSQLREPVFFLQKISPHQREEKFALLSRSCSAPAFVWTCPLNPRDIKGFPHVTEAPWPVLK